jgi:hypothetical protein
VTGDVRDDQSQSRGMDAWLDRRSEPAPATLRARISLAVDTLRGELPSNVADLSARAGEELLDRLLADGCAARSAAPDLLAADALVTYSFEALADDANATARSIGERAARTMSDIASLGARR